VGRVLEGSPEWYVCAWGGLLNGLNVHSAPSVLLVQACGERHGRRKRTWECYGRQTQGPVGQARRPEMDVVSDLNR